MDKLFEAAYFGAKNITYVFLSTYVLKSCGHLDFGNFMKSLKSTLIKTDLKCYPY